MSQAPAKPPLYSPTHFRRGVLVAAALGIWVWLHYTTAGALYLARQRVLYAAATEIRDDPALARTAHALGVLGRRGDVESFAATVKDHDFRGLVLAAGYAALPEPECARASAALEGLQRASALMGARSLLLLQKRCGGAWMLRARPDPLTEDAMLRWGRALAETGHENEARALLSRPDFPAKDRLPLAAAIAIGLGTEFILDEQDLMAWSGEDDASSRLYEATKELERLDLGARLADTGSRRLMQHALTALTELGRAGFGNWNHQQRLAAHLAGAGDDAASTVLGDVPLTALTSPSEAPGLAWRALALHRLGQQSESLAAFEQAEVAGRTLTPQTRSWREWFDIATASALAEEWRRACRAAEAPGDEATRFGLRCWVIELWAHRDQPQSRW